MKVSPEYFIQLSHRVNTLHREKEKIIESPGDKGQEGYWEPKGKGTRKHCKPQSKDRVDISHMYTNKPRSKDRAYYQENQSFKTGNNTSI